jgi:uncharacterized protein YndB with AHSA1/START domain
MTRIITAINIGRPVEQVFEYITTPANWPRWHPSSLAVSGATDHSLTIGEQVTEKYQVAGRRGEVVWTVRASEAPYRWVIEGTIADGGGGGTIVYTLAPRIDGTFFTREFTYTMPNRLLALLDWLVLRRRVAAESAEALHRLKEALEGS